MIEIKIGETPYKLRTNWNEVTFNGYCEIVKAQSLSFDEKLSVFTGIPGELLGKMKLKQVAIISDVLEFMDEPDTVQAFGVGYESDFNVGESQYWKVEKCKQLLKDKPYPITAGAEMIELFTGDKDGEGGEKISDKPVTEVIGKVVCYFSKLDAFFTRFKRLNDYKPSEDYKEAGIERLNNLGSIITVLKLAQRTNRTEEEVWQQPAESMYIILLVDFEESEFQKRLQQVQKENEALQALARK